MQCHKLKVVFVFPTRSKWLLSTYQDFARKLVHLHHCHLQIYNKKSISPGAAQAQQQYKNTISRSADSTSQATVQEHNQQVSRQYRPSNSIRAQSAGQETYKPSNSTRTQSAGQQTVQDKQQHRNTTVSYTHLRAHET